ncbi:MAG: sulfatase-like hydrolase/transferase [Acidobacteriota bacterium]
MTASIVAMGVALAGMVAAPPPDVVLLTLDTTRADRVGAYGSPAALTPHLDRLARRGATFEEPFGSVPITLPSHTTMLTGKYPCRTGIRDNGLAKLDGATDTLATVLKGRGYHCRAYLSSAVLDRAFGLDRGFEIYDDELRSAGRRDERSAFDTIARVARDAPSAARPLFLWVHLYDPHLPYAPPAPFDRLAPGLPGAYAGEVAVMDAGAGRLLAVLRARKILDTAVILAAGDHGEALGDHGETSHGVLLYDPCLEVPMILVEPSRGIAGRTVRGLARLADVAPTLADYAGAPPLASADGTSLRGSVAAGKTAVAHVYQETWMPPNSFGWSPLYALRRPDWHLVHATANEMYEVAVDPGESRDRAKDPAAPTAAMERVLQGYVAARTIAPAAEPPPDLKAELESLGYLSPSSGKAGTLDPRAGLPLLEKMSEAKELMARGSLDQAIALLRDVLKVNPENVVARNDLGISYLRSKLFREAAREFSAALGVRDLDYINVNLGKSLEAQGLLDPARASYRRALARNGRFADAYEALADLEVAAGKTADAAAVIGQAEKNGVRDPMLIVVRGRLEAAAGDVPRALKSFEEAAAIDPASFDATVEQGHALYVLGKKADAVRKLEDALRIRPDDVPLLKTLASIYFEEVPNPARSRECFERVLRVAPDDPDAPRIRQILAAPK